MTSTLFGHLAFSFASSPENLATEALAYILSCSTEAQSALTTFLSEDAIHLPPRMAFETQVSGDDQAQPDLVGYDELRRPTLIIEAKFWAGLTSNQPSTYVKRILEIPTGMVVFLAPQRRLASLWPEIIQRCDPPPAQPPSEFAPNAALLAARLTDRHILALTSWRAALAAIRKALEAHHQLAALADLQQLEGLCDRMDQDAFIPLRTEELGPERARRILDFCAIVDDLAKAAVDRKLVPPQKANQGASAGQYGRYIVVGPYSCNLQFNSDWWSKHRETPLWVQVQDKVNYKFPSGAKAALSFLEAKGRLGLVSTRDSILVPLAFPAREEKPRVIEALLHQLAAVFLALSGEKSDGAQHL